MRSAAAEREYVSLKKETDKEEKPSQDDTAEKSDESEKE